MWVVALGDDDMSDLLTHSYLLEDIYHTSLIHAQLSMLTRYLTPELCKRLTDEGKADIVSPKGFHRLPIADKYRQDRVTELARFSESEMISQAEILTENKECLWMCHR